MIQTPRITDRELDLISRLVYQHTGIRLGPEKRHLVELRLGKILRLEGIPTYEQYYRMVLADKSGQRLRQLLDAITTNFTQFFREAQHFWFLKDQVIPEMQRRGQKAVSVWSAACATGEEPYSIAITLLESPLAKGWRKEVFASDISTKALARAKEGVYPEDALRGLDPSIVRRYFSKVEGGYRVREIVRGIVTFAVFNLLSEPPWKERFDAIFCRNVMIYFDRETRAKVVNNLLKALKPGGYLMVGHVEGFFGQTDGLKLVRPSIYRKDHAADSGGHRRIQGDQ